MSRPAARPSRRAALGSAALALAAAAVLLPAATAEARPKHMSIFGKFYAEQLDKDLVKKTKCNVCHEKTQKSKKFRNPYGMELSKLLEKNEKDEDTVIAALKKAEEKKSCVEGKTYGDLIKDGKLPTEECKPVEEEDELAALVPVPDPTMN